MSEVGGNRWYRRPAFLRAAGFFFRATAWTTTFSIPAAYLLMWARAEESVTLTHTQILAVGWGIVVLAALVLRGERIRNAVGDVTSRMAILLVSAAVPLVSGILWLISVQASVAAVLCMTLFFASGEIYRFATSRDVATYRVGRFSAAPENDDAR